jgi:hypothetical protein
MRAPLYPITPQEVYKHAAANEIYRSQAKRGTTHFPA